MYWLILIRAPFNNNSFHNTTLLHFSSRRYYPDQVQTVSTNVSQHPANYTNRGAPANESRIVIVAI